MFVWGFFNPREVIVVSVSLVSPESPKAEWPTSPPRRASPTPASPESFPSELGWEGGAADNHSWYSDLGNWIFQCFPQPQQTQSWFCSRAAPGWDQGGECPSLWIKDSQEQRKRDSQPMAGFYKGTDTSNPPFLIMHFLKCSVNRTCRNQRSSHPLHTPSLTAHLLPQPSAGWELGIFTPPKAGPQGSYILRSVLGFIQPPYSNVSTEESPEPPSHSQPWQLLHINKCKCTVILLLLTRLATSLELCREPARKKQALDQASLLRK